MLKNFDSINYIIKESKGLLVLDLSYRVHWQRFLVFGLFLCLLSLVDGPLLFL